MTQLWRWVGLEVPMMVCPTASRLLSAAARRGRLTRRVHGIGSTLIRVGQMIAADGLQTMTLISTATLTKMVREQVGSAALVLGTWQVVTHSSPQRYNLPCEPT